MNFIEIEEAIRTSEWSMADLHSHAHFELYFLLEGTRKFFIDNAVYNITAPCFIAISPYTMHKTEGVGFRRININISSDAIRPFEKQVLSRLDCKPLPINQKKDYISSLLSEAVRIYSLDSKYSGELLESLTEYIIYTLDNLSRHSKPSGITVNAEKVSSTALKIADYLTENFNKDITLDALSKKFFLSKVSLCATFKKDMNCTIIEYLTKIRLNKAKQYLSSGKKSVEEIADLCGFSSAAYMGIVFKKNIGISPLGYRKVQKTKI